MNLIRRNLPASALLFLGAALRCGQFLFNRSVTEGEAALALNIISRTFAGLLQPLDLVQAAPVGFLFLQRIFYLVFGNNDYTLRILPLAAGLVSLPLFYALGRRIMNKPGLFMGLILFAGSDYLIYFSSELKQYSTDVTIGLAITVLAIRLMRPDLLQRDRWFFLACCLAGIWFSHPALFVLSSAGVILFWIARKNPSQTRQSWWFAFALAFAASALLNYFISLRALAGHAEFQNFWQPAFMPIPPRSFTDLAWFIKTPAKYFHNPAGFLIALVIPAAIAAILGLIVMIHKYKRETALLVLPIGLCLIASALRKYPFDGRLLLFTVPATLVLISSGLGWLVNNRGRLVRVCGWVLAAIVIIPVTGSALARFVHPRRPEELRPVMKYLQEQYQEKDAVYLYYAAVNGFNYYCRQMDFYPKDTLVGVEARDQWDDYFRDAKRGQGRPRVWLIFSHIATWGGIDEEKIILDYWDRLGQRLDSFKASGASAYLYDRSKM